MPSVDPDVDLSGVKVGDILLHFMRLGGAREREQIPTERVVDKVGRKLVYVRRPDDRSEHASDAYRIEGGYKNDGYSHSQVMTPEQYDRKQRTEQVWELLRERGLTPNIRRDGPRLETLEAIVKLIDEMEAGG